MTEVWIAQRVGGGLGHSILHGGWTLNGRGPSVVFLASHANRKKRGEGGARASVSEFRPIDANTQSTKNDRLGVPNGRLRVRAIAFESLKGAGFSPNLNSTACVCRMADCVSRQSHLNR